VLFSVHISIVVHHAFNTPPTERLQQFHFLGSNEQSK